MHYLLIDDEEHAVKMLEMLLKKSSLINEEDSIVCLNNPETAWEYLKTQSVDIVFMDIEMPKLTGLDLADRISEELSNPPEIIFVTAYPQYALKAWETGAVGYILKPYDRAQINKVLERAIALCGIPKRETVPEAKTIRIRCFPTFNLTVNNSTVSFQNSKSKELLALLVHYEGMWIDLDKITFALFENLEERSSKNYIRTITYRLRRTLSNAGCEELIESRYGQLRVNTNLFTCDYYEYLQGNKSLFHGEYMGEYPWAETALATRTHDM